MSGTALLTEIISILVAGITAMGKGIGEGLSALTTSIFMTGTGDAQTLSVFGTVVIVFAAIALSMSLTRWVVNFVTSLGQRNR